ncbi:MAG: hypothetical protein VB957_12860 [Pseudomonadales bacterium]
MSTAQPLKMWVLKACPLWVGLWPIIAIHISYFIAASAGHVDWCNPYWDSCTSISATGRHGVEFYWFKLTMIPAALLMSFYWHRIAIWQQFLGGANQWISRFGYIACAFLIMYVIALGLSGDQFRIQRRIGVILYFTLTYLAQLLLVTDLWRRGFRSQSVQLMFAFCAACLGIGLMSLAIDMLTDWHDDIEDAIEWILALLMHLYIIACYWAWRATGFNGQANKTL